MTSMERSTTRRLPESTVPIDMVSRTARPLYMGAHTVSSDLSPQTNQ